MLADGHSIGRNKTQPLPAESDTLITADHEMSNESAAKFQKLMPLNCVRSTEDEKGDKQKYD